MGLLRAQAYMYADTKLSNFYMENGMAKTLLYPTYRKALKRGAPKPEPGIVRALQYMNETENKSFYYGFEYGLVTKRKRVLRNTNHACHAEMSVWAPGAQAVWSKMPGPKDHKDDENERHVTMYSPRDRKIVMAWNDWLVHRSPWKSVFVQTTTKFTFWRGFVTHANVPANFLVNALIATRTPSEYIEKVRVWYSLRQAGCHEDMAFLLCIVFNANGNVNPGSEGHLALEMGEITTDTAERFCFKGPHHLNEPYNLQTDYYPCNAIWQGGGVPFVRHIKQTYEPAKDRGDAPRRMFMVADYENDKVYSMDDLARIGKLEYERMKRNVRKDNPKKAAA